MDVQQNFIDGRFLTGGGERIEVLNATRDTVISQIPDTPADTVDEAVASAKRAQSAWEKLPAIKRAGYLRQISAKIRCTEAGEMPIWPAMARTVQCVTSPGGGSSVRETTRSTSSVASRGMRAGRVWSRSSPSTPAAR